MRRGVLTTDELVALREAVRAIPWMPLSRSPYLAVRPVEEKLDQAIALTARRAREADHTSDPPG